MTPFALLCDSCGLSMREASAFLDTRFDTVQSWSSGRRSAAPGALDDLRELFGKIDRAATETAKIIRKNQSAEVIELGLAADDHEAQSIGWPCVGAHGAVIRRVMEITGDRRIVIVPRGSTPGTAAAADVHRK